MLRHWSGSVQVPNARTSRRRLDDASAYRLPDRPRQSHRWRYDHRGRAAGEATRHRRTRTGPDVLVAGPADSVRHDVIGRPRGTHSRDQAAPRGGRAWSPRSSRPVGSTSAAGWCRRRMAYWRYSMDYVAAKNEAQGQAGDVAWHLCKALGRCASLPPRPQASMPGRMARKIQAPLSEWRCLMQAHRKG
jgi:hypothetical protein